MGLYSDILAATIARLEALPALTGVPVVLRPQPGGLSPIDVYPQILVAPREDIAEVEMWVGFNNRIILGYEVYVGLLMDHRPADTDFLFNRLDIREAIRLALYKSNAVGLTPNFARVKYDPNPGGTGGARRDNPNARPTWQRFTYGRWTVREAPP